MDPEDFYNTGYDVEISRAREKIRRERKLAEDRRRARHSGDNEWTSYSE